jgi:hypothetical protein
MGSTTRPESGENIMSTYIKHLMADTENGIQVVDPVDYPDADWELSLGDFQSALPRLEDGEQAFFAANPDQFAELQAEYGISE